MSQRSEKAADLLDLLRWVINVLILVIGFFVASKLKAVDTLEGRIRDIELWQAGDIERDIQAMQKLDLILSKLDDARVDRMRLDNRIDQLLINNPELNRTP